MRAIATRCLGAIIALSVAATVGRADETKADRVVRRIKTVVSKVEQAHSDARRLFDRIEIADADRIDEVLLVQDDTNLPDMDGNR